MISYSIDCRTKDALCRKRLRIECAAPGRHEKKIYTLCASLLDSCTYLEVDFENVTAVDLPFVNTLCTVHMLALLTNKQFTVNGLAQDMFASLSEHIRNTRSEGCLFSLCPTCYLAELCGGHFEEPAGAAHLST